MFCYSILHEMCKLCCCVWFVRVALWVFHWILFYLYPPWWNHQMETFSALLILCERSPPVTVGFPSQRPVMRSFDFSLICGWTTGWEINRDAGDLIRHRTHYKVTVVWYWGNYGWYLGGMWDTHRILSYFVCIKKLPIDGFRTCLPTSPVKLEFANSARMCGMHGCASRKTSGWKIKSFHSPSFLTYDKVYVSAHFLLINMYSFFLLHIGPKTESPNLTPSFCHSIIILHKTSRGMCVCVCVECVCVCVGGGGGGGGGQGGEGSVNI